MANFFTSLVGSKPTVPTLPPLSLSVEQQKALTANLQAIPQAEKIAAKVDLFNQKQIDEMLMRVIPNYQGITGAVSQNIEDMSRGLVPTDVQELEQQSAAARGIGGGLGTEQIKNLVARDLGRTSLDLTTRGQASAQSWIQSMSSIYYPGQFNISSMFVNPTQMAAFDTQERNAAFQVQWMKNQIEAMPAPWAEDLKQFVYRAMAAYSGGSVPENPYSKPLGQQVGGGPGSGAGGTAFNFNPYSGTPGAAGAASGATGMIGTSSGPEGMMGSWGAGAAGAAAEGGVGAGISGLVI